MVDHLQILLGFYFRPLASVARVLDEGKLGWAIGIAVVTALLLQGPAHVLQQKRMADILVQAQSEYRATADEVEGPRQSAKAVELQRKIASAHAPAFSWWPDATGSLRELALVGIILTPIAISLLGWWEGLGHSRGLMTRNYGSVLACLSMAWAAAKLPAVPLGFLRLNLADDPPWAIWIIPATWVLFAIFAGFVFRTSLGARWPGAFGVSVLGSGALLAGTALSAGLGGISYMFASPWLLYMLWMRFGGSASALGDALHGSQNYRRSLEAISLNPHDADAQFQLGLIELQRRNFVKAEERFRAAIKIDASDADYFYHLGLVLKETAKHQEAHDLFERGVALNEKASNHEVLRELGYSQMELGHMEESIQTLDRYTNLRPYDPVGLVYYGQALRKAGSESDANASFEKAIEVWGTLPKWRAAELRSWERTARKELKK